MVEGAFRQPAGGPELCLQDGMQKVPMKKHARLQTYRVRVGTAWRRSVSQDPVALPGQHEPAWMAHRTDLPEAGALSAHGEFQSARRDDENPEPDNEPSENDDE